VPIRGVCVPQAEEEKQRRKEEKKQAATTTATATTRAGGDVEADMAGVSTLAVPVPATNAPAAAMAVDDVPLLIDTTVPNLRAALDIADVVVHVLDARDPLSFRSAFVERESKSKKQVFVLNKIGVPLVVCQEFMLMCVGQRWWYRPHAEGGS
jgi:nuclear GTP-binding protein